MGTDVNLEILVYPMKASLRFRRLCRQRFNSRRRSGEGGKGGQRKMTFQRDIKMLIHPVRIPMQGDTVNSLL